RSYEHYIRIPSLTAGIIFSLCIAFIVYKTIDGAALRVTALALLCFTPFIFDYSYLARGYALALAAFYAEIAVVIWLLSHRIAYRSMVVPIVVISLLNFMAFGSMLSSMLALAAFNAVFAGLYSWRIIREKRGRLKIIAINLVSIFAMSSGLIFLLYRGMYKNMIGSRALTKMNSGWHGWSSLGDFLNQLLIVRVFARGNNFGAFVFYAVIALLLAAIGLHIYRFVESARNKTSRRSRGIDNPAAFMLLVTAAMFIMIFVYSIILNNSLGRLRSQVFLTPLVLISSVIILEKFAAAVSKPPFDRLAYAVVLLLVVSVTLGRLPSFRRFDKYSMTGPLVRMLKAIDPNKKWSMGFSEPMGLLYMAFRYYQQFGYNLTFAPKKPPATNPSNFDVVIYRMGRQPEKSLCIDWEYFSDFSVAVTINSALPSDKVIINAAQPKD
ncbi:MAG: hypothetical protein KAR47_02485, partial [Planctomycetes bacterium]|nr:hypothetical protein [Planctomycetota bacterium]